MYNISHDSKQVLSLTIDCDESSLSFKTCVSQIALLIWDGGCKNYVNISFYSEITSGNDEN